MARKPQKRPALEQPHDPSYRLIALTQGLAVKVDAADYEWLAQWNWSAKNISVGCFYAQKRDGKNIVTMHRFILGDLEKGHCVDHRDGDGLNNRRRNLRIATHADNMKNRKINKNNKAGVKGVYRSGNRWIASISANSAQRYLGSFSDINDASNAYAAASKELHGEFSRP